MKPPAGLSPPPDENFAINRTYWNAYPSLWDEPERLRPLVDAASLVDVDGDPSRFTVIGEEWGDKQSVEEVVRTGVLPYVTTASTVGEIGCGGGRVALMVAPHVGSLHCFDIAPAMLARAAVVLRGQPNVRLVQLESSKLIGYADDTFDFLYSFDVFVHLDLHTQWSYLKEFRRVLRPGGRALVHCSNITTDNGWARFVQQDAYSVTGFWFSCPQIVTALVERAGLSIVDVPALAESNFYGRRDYIVVVGRDGRD